MTAARLPVPGHHLARQAAGGSMVPHAPEVRAPRRPAASPRCAPAPPWCSTPRTPRCCIRATPDVAMPIASITKLMTALVVIDAGQPLDEVLIVTDDDRSLGKGSSSRLLPGTRLTRGDLMHLALMSSENRAAHALGRNYPGRRRRLRASP